VRGRRLDPANPEDVAAAELTFRERTRPALIFEVTPYAAASVNAAASP
jgi:hypothetical protein